ncbi:MAG: hypothetical protein NVSMB18_06470 [Acetobacteraceae bacterium]
MASPVALARPTALPFPRAFPPAGRQYYGGARADDAPSGAALDEAEVIELAARLLLARSEAERDHLLAATLTHAAHRAGSVLTASLGRTLGGALKPVAARALDRAGPNDPAFGWELEGLATDDRAFAAAQRFVRLAGEAARHAAAAGATEGEVAAPPRRKALSALAAAAEVHAPGLLPGLTGRPAQSGTWVRRGRVIELHGASRVPAPRLTVSRHRPQPVPIAPFEYDPEMEYFLGGLVRSVGRAVGSAAKFVGRTVTSAAHAVGDLSSSVADTLGKVPFIGAGLKGLYGFTYGALIQSVDSAVSGVRLDKVLSRHLESQIKNVKEVAPYVQTVIAFVPGIGPGVSGAISAGLSLAQGRPIDEALVDAAAGALPGGALAKSMAKMAFAAASGKPLSDIAIAALPLAPAAKDGLKAGLRVATDVAQGKPVDKALLSEANRQIERLPAAYRKAAQIGVALGQGKKLQDIAVQQLPNMIGVGGPLAKAGQKIAMSSPILRQARGLVAKGQHGFDVAQGLMAHAAVPHQLSRARSAFKGEALKGFDRAVALRVGRIAPPRGRPPALARMR